MSKYIIKLFWPFWYSTTIMTGILAGFMISHSIMLGRFYTWMVESGNVDSLLSSYSIFRLSNLSYNSVYYSFFIIALISGIIWAVLALTLKRDRIIATIAGLATVWVAVIYLGTGFGRVEDAVLSGIANETTMQIFVSLNIPIHISFAVIYTVALFLLLVVALTKKKTIDEKDKG